MRRSIAEIIIQRDEAKRGLSLPLSWASVRYDHGARTATLYIMWLLDPFDVPPALVEEGVSMSGGECAYTEEVALELEESGAEPAEIERDVLQSAWILRAPDATRTEDETEIRWAFHADYASHGKREAREIGSRPFSGPGNRLEVRFES